MMFQGFFVLQPDQMQVGDFSVGIDMWFPLFTSFVLLQQHLG